MVKHMLLAATLSLVASVASAQSLPKSADEVARPGGDLPGSPKIALVKVADGFNDPVGVSSAFDGSGRLFVVERVGKVRIVKDGKILAKPFLDLTKSNPLGTEVLTVFVEQGLWSIAFHPKFKDNGYVFVSFASVPFNGAHMVVRLTVDPSSPDEITTEQVNKTAKVVLNIPQPYYNHYGGKILFGPDGYLYVGKGDAGWEGDPLDAGQTMSTLWGKMLRVNVDTDDDVSYSIPKDNPFSAAGKDRMMALFGITEEGFSKIKIGSRPEIWAYGLRNPWQFTFDPKSGDLWIGDVGQNHWEEINWQPASSKGGENYGWKHNQASHCHPTLGPDDKCPTVGVLPVAEYPHQEPYPGATKLKDGWGCSVTGLGVANFGGMNGVYIAGDWCSGRVWGVGWDGAKWQMQELLHTTLQFTGGNHDEDGSILAVNCHCFYLDDKGAMANPKGALWRVMAADAVPAGAETARSRSK
ncbi:MAG TPA: PQQ-dependent sugar dehydrogenase [Burkholderiales bacterium]|nr:PQQ-dependent sugar dehydrogenase [Burkholderiales bacterium]